MPIRLTRFLIALTLALVVPLQGFAAASAGLCMALGDHDAGMAHVHDGDAADHSHDQGSDPSVAHCPPCVACCAAAAISSSVPVFLGDDRAHALIAAAPPVFSGIPPEILDRPPLAL